jgi:L-amino acid N-acyltransferase YncA
MRAAIRIATNHDAEQIRAIYAPIVCDTAISFEIDTPTTEEIQRRISNTLATYPFIVCEERSAVKGYAYASRHRDRAAYQWSVDVSVYVEASEKHRGIATALYTSLFEILRSQGYYNAYAGIALPNPASVGFHRSMQFQPVGVYRHVGYKLGAWHDVSWWERSLQPLREPPDLPRGLTSLSVADELEVALASGAVLIRN